MVQQTVTTLHRRLLTLVVVVLMFQIDLSASWSSPTCQQMKKISRGCLESDVERLYIKARAVAGGRDHGVPISEQVCQLCKLFNTSRGCLEPLFDSCEYIEIHEFLWNTKVPYMGTLASLCGLRNVFNEIHQNIDCYYGITDSLRRCFEALEDQPSCGELICQNVKTSRLVQRTHPSVTYDYIYPVIPVSAWKGYSCSTKMAETICTSLFSQGGRHEQLSLLYLRSIEPMIDHLNCSSESELYVAEIFPDLQYRWRQLRQQPQLPLTQTVDDKPKRIFSPVFGFSSSSIVSANAIGLLFAALVVSAVRCI